jgi:hypothetical protein
MSTENAPDFKADELNQAVTSDKSGRLDHVVGGVDGSERPSIKTNIRYTQPDTFIDNILK